MQKLETILRQERMKIGPDPMIARELAEVWKSTGDCSYLKAAVRVAAANPQMLGAFRAMIQSQPRFVSDHEYKPWIDGVAALFGAKHYMSGPLAEYAIEKERSVSGLHIWERKSILTKIDKVPRTILTALEDRPWLGKALAKKALGWLHYGLASEFARIACDYGPIEGAVEAFVEYRYEPHTSECWGKWYSRFVRAFSKAAGGARPFADDRKALTAFVRGTDFATSFEDNMGRFIRISERCREAPALFNRVIGLTAKEDYEDPVPWKKADAALRRPWPEGLERYDSRRLRKYLG